MIGFQVRVTAPHRTKSGPSLNVVIAQTDSLERARWIVDIAKRQILDSLGPSSRPLMVAGIVVDAFGKNADDWRFRIERIDNTPRIEVVE